MLEWFMRGLMVLETETNSVVPHKRERGYPVPLG